MRVLFTEFVAGVIRIYCKKLGSSLSHALHKCMAVLYLKIA